MQRHRKPRVPRRDLSVSAVQSPITHLTTQSARASARFPRARHAQQNRCSARRPAARRCTDGRPHSCGGTAGGSADAGLRSSSGGGARRACARTRVCLRVCLCVRVCVGACVRVWRRARAWLYLRACPLLCVIRECACVHACTQCVRACACVRVRARRPARGGEDVTAELRHRRRMALVVVGLGR